MPEQPGIGALDAALTTWLRRGHEFGLGRKYMESLDLTSGSALVADCEAVCPWFGDTVVAERNYLRLMVQRAVATNRVQIQVVLLGPDMSPFCLELLESMPNVRALFEVGGPSLALKEELIRMAAPKSLSRLRFQVADIGVPGLRTTLVDEGDNDLQAEMPTIVIAENASQFSAEALTAALGAFRGSGRNMIIAHHMVPAQEARERDMAQNLGAVFQRHCPQWKTHSSESMRSIFAQAGTKSVSQQGMRVFESTQPSGPPHFTDSDGWARISYGVI
jgi:hypothetical protein